MFLETPAFEQNNLSWFYSFQGLDKDLGNNIMNNHTGTLTDTLSAIVTVSDNTNSYWREALGKYNMFCENAENRE